MPAVICSIVSEETLKNAEWVKIMFNLVTQGWKNKQEEEFQLKYSRAHVGTIQTFQSFLSSSEAKDDRVAGFSSLNLVKAALMIKKKILFPSEV